MITDKTIPVGIHNSKTCCKCGAWINPENAHGDLSFVSAGYGRNDKGEILCFQCCGWEELASMRDNGRVTLYLTENTRNGDTLGRLGNWPGTFEIAARVRKGKHNIARTRYDVWFRAFDRNWHGVQYGENTQLCHCNVLKG